MMKSSFLKKALPHVIAIILFLVVAVVYCRPVLEGKVVNQSDIQQYKEMARQSFEYKEKYGRFPLWIESAFAGMPAYTIAIDAGPAISYGYLGTIMYLGLPQPICFFFLACVCFYILMAVLRVDPWVATLASLAYAYSSYDPIIIGTGHVTKMWAIAWAPGVIAAFLMLLKRNYWWGTALFAFFFAEQLSTQHLQIVYYTGICAVLIGLFYIVDAFRKGNIRHTAIALGLAVLAGGIAFGTSVGATLPDEEYTKETMRGGRTELSSVSKQESKNGLSYDYAFMWSYGIPETMTLVVPDAVGGGGLNSPEIGDNSKFADRAAQELNLPEEQALQLANGIAYWGPQPSTSGPVYLGAVICFLTIFALVLLKGGWLKWSLVATIILGIVMAWGDHFTAVNYFLFDHLPYYNKFRSPSTALFLPQLAAPILVALALQQLLSGELDTATLWKKFRTTAVIGGGLILVILGYYATAGFKPSGKYNTNDEEFKQSLAQQKAQQLTRTGQTPEAAQAQAQASVNTVFKGLGEDRQSMYASDMWRSIALIVLTGVLLGLFLKKKIKPVIFLVGLLLLTSYDLLAVDSRYLKTDSYVDPADLEQGMAPSQADQQIMADPDKNFRVYDESDRSLSQNARANNFYNSLGGYSPAKLGLYEDLRLNQLMKGNIQVFNMLNTRYIVEQDPRTGQLHAERNPGAFGACWLVNGIHYVRSGDEEMQALDSVNVRDTVVIQQKYASRIPFQPIPDTTASIHLVDNILEKIDYKFSSKTNQFAVFSEIYYDKGWDVYLDGKKADYLRVDYLLRGMPVPAGDHTIEFRFEPHSYKIGTMLTTWFSLIIYGLLFAAVYVEWRKRKAKAPAAKA
jgi:hypothetical protein